MNSNTVDRSRRANTGSALLDLLSDTSLKLVHLERRFDPFVRPAFDAVLRDPLARFVTALINAQRVDEKLALAEETPAARRGGVRRLDHRELPSSRCAACGSRAASSAAATPRRRASCAPSSSSTTACRRSSGTASSPSRKTYRAWVRFSGPGPVHHAGHRRRRLHEHQHQADGRARPEADGRGEVHPGHVRRLAADLRHARRAAPTRSCRSRA